MQHDQTQPALSLEALPNGGDEASDRSVPSGNARGRRTRRILLYGAGSVIALLILAAFLMPAV